MRLDRLLTNCGVCTRSRAKSFVARREVLVDGKACSPSTHVAPTSLITIGGKPLEYQRPLHIMLHKPPGYICSTARDTGDSKIIYDLLPPVFSRRKPALVCAGRLDKWASGLVLLSQSGSLVHRIITPKWRSGVYGKVYEVRLQRPVSGREEQEFASGQLRLRNEKTPLRPAKFEVVNQEENLVRITLYEGRYHQLRRMLATLGNRSVEIKRVTVGPIQLGNLPMGHWKELSDEELHLLGLERKVVDKEALSGKLSTNINKSYDEDSHIYDDGDDDNDYGEI